MKRVLPVLAAFVVLSVYTTGVAILGGHQVEAQHAGDYLRGFDAGVAARDAQTRDANDRLIAAGLCRYADLACTRHK